MLQLVKTKGVLFVSHSARLLRILVEHIKCYLRDRPFVSCMYRVVSLLVCVTVTFELSINFTELKFINPRPRFLHVFPDVRVVATEGRYTILRCCGTGFTSINW